MMVTPGFDIEPFPCVVLASLRRTTEQIKDYQAVQFAEFESSSPELFKKFNELYGDGIAERSFDDFLALVSQESFVGLDGATDNTMALRRARDYLAAHPSTDHEKIIEKKFIPFAELHYPSAIMDEPSRTMANNYKFAKFNRLPPLSNPNVAERYALQDSGNGSGGDAGGNFYFNALIGPGDFAFWQAREHPFGKAADAKKNSIEFGQHTVADFGFAKHFKSISAACIFLKDPAPGGLSLTQVFSFIQVVALAYEA
jgi:hypothetical protein